MLTCAEYAKKALHFGIGFKYFAVRGRIDAALRVCARVLVARVPETIEAK